MLPSSGLSANCGRYIDIKPSVNWLLLYTQHKSLFGAFYTRWINCLSVELHIILTRTRSIASMDQPIMR